MSIVKEIVCNACGMSNGDCFCGKDWSVVEMTIIPNCDYCNDENTVTASEYDARTYGGFWAYMCKLHYLLNAKDAELGLGKGQRLVKINV